MMVGLVAVLACNARPPVPELVAHQTPVVPCEAARTRTRAATDDAKIIAQFDHCSANWGIALDVLCHVSPMHFDNTDQTIEYVGRWVLVYSAPDGSVATYEHKVPTGTTACTTPDRPGNIASPSLDHLVDLAPPRTYDFDGDGNPEILIVAQVPSWMDHPEAPGESFYTQRRSDVLTYANKVISYYKPATGLGEVVDMKDLDGDGRPELLIAYDQMPASGPKRVAHSLADGRFSTKDETAKRLLLAQCPVAQELLVERGGAVDRDASLSAIACAALRGERGRDVRTRAEAECKQRGIDCLDYARWANDMYLYGIGSE